MTKKYLLLLVLPVIGIVAGGMAYAAPRPQGDMAARIAQKFNLSENDVQQVFTQHRTEMQEKMNQNFSDSVNKAVVDGKLTQDQANKILAKKAELQAEKATWQDKTKEEILEIQRSHRGELRSWAEENNIPLQYLRFGMGGGLGRGFGGMGGRANCPLAK